MSKWLSKGVYTFMEILVFGAGRTGVKIAKEADMFGMNIIYFVDNNANNASNQKFFDIEVVKPNDYRLEKLKSLPVFIAIAGNQNSAVSVKSQLEDLGFINIAANLDERKKYYPDAIVNSKRNPKISHAFASMEITTSIGCPVGCKFCPQKLFVNKYKSIDKNAPLKFPLNDYRKCLDAIPTTVEICFSGFSEPFLNKNCAEMIKYAFDRGHPVSLNSTLVGLTDKCFNYMQDVMFRRVRLHLPDTNDYCNIKVTDDYLKLLDKFLSTIQSEKFIYVSHDNDTPAAVKNTINNSPYPYVYPYKLEKEIHDRAGNLDNDLAPCTPFLKGAIYCGKGARMPNYNILLPNGMVLLCCMDFDMKHVLGNLLTMGYEELFECDEMEKLNQAFDDDKMELICRTCAWACNI